MSSNIQRTFQNSLNLLPSTSNSDLFADKDASAMDSIIIRICKAIVKCHPLFRPKFRKVKIRFFVEIREVSDTLTPNVGVCGDTPV